MKRITSILMSVVLIVSAVFIHSAVAKAAATTVSAKNVETSAGETFSFDISIGNNTGFQYMRVQIIYDPEVMECQSIAEGTVRGESFLSGVASEKARNITIQSNVDIVNNGSLATVTFLLKEDVPEGTYPITLDVKEAYDIDYDDLDIKVDSLLVTALCTHDLKKTDAKDATHEEEGNIEYYTCSKCGKLFADEAATKEITQEDIMIPVEAHVYGDWQFDEENHWKECECGDVADKAEHTFGEWTVIKDATEEEKGTKERVCSVCNYAETEEIEKLPHTHQLKKIEAVPPTHTEDGNIEYYVCSKCGKLYADESGTEEIQKEKTVVEETGHEFGDAYKSDNDGHWKECSCGAREEESAHVGGTATCYEKAVCEVCGVEYGSYDTDNHVGGTEVKNALKATEDTEGYTGDTYCKGCGELIEKGEVIPPLSHTHQMKKVEAVSPTHTEAGNIEYYVCSKCGKLYADETGTEEIQREDTVVAPTGHEFGDSYKSDGEKHWKECSCGARAEEGIHAGGVATCHEKAVCEVCGVEYGSYDTDNHTGGTEIRNAVEAKEGVEGYTGDTYCKGCNELVEKGKVIPALEPEPSTEETTREETTEPSTEETVEPSTEETVEPSTEETVEPSTEETVEPSTEETVEPSTEETVEPSTEEATEPSSEETTPEETEPSSEETTPEETKAIGLEELDASDTGDKAVLFWEIAVLAGLAATSAVVCEKRRKRR